MKLHFEPNLDYQHAAIESVCDLFRGQEICRTEFTVTVRSFWYSRVKRNPRYQTALRARCLQWGPA